MTVHNYLRTIVGALTIGQIAVASSVAWANGSGYQGPDLNPTAVPVQSEKGLLVSDVENAYRICVFDGDKQQKIIPALQKVLTAMYGLSVKIDFKRDDIERQRVKSDYVEYSNKCQVRIIDAVATTSCRGTTTLPSLFELPYLTLDLVPHGDFKHELEVSVGLPVTVFSKVVQEKTVDAWGVQTVSDARLFGVTVAAPGTHIQDPYVRSLPEPDASYPGVFMNNLPDSLPGGKHFFMTPLTYDVPELMACLQDQLQQAAK